jgi:hypothetical protein
LEGSQEVFVVVGNSPVEYRSGKSLELHGVWLRSYYFLTRAVTYRRQRLETTDREIAFSVHGILNLHGSNAQVCANTSYDLLLNNVRSSR